MDDQQFAQENNIFLAWLTASRKAVLNPKILLADLRSVGAGRGIVTREPLEDDELLFRIPCASVLTVENSALNQLIPEDLACLDPWLVCIVSISCSFRRPSNGFGHWF